jgi:chemotaxis protein CheY-P-specific phosphatase CheC
MITQPTRIERCSEDLYAKIAGCLDGAAKQISAALGRPIGINTATLSVLDMWKVPVLFWQPEEEIVAIYISISGDIQGYIMLEISTHEACQLIEMMRCRTKGMATTLGTLERSALGEIAKLTSIALCKAVTEGVFFNIRLSPPAVLVQPASFALDILGPDTIDSPRQALVAENYFLVGRHKVKALLVIAPETPSLATVLEVRERRWEIR